MSEPGEATNPPGELASAPGAIVRVLEICNKKGLHARASAKFVQTVGEIRRRREGDARGETVGGTSIMGLMMLAAGPGTTITVEATGPRRPRPSRRWPRWFPGGSAKRSDAGTTAAAARLQPPAEAYKEIFISLLPSTRALL